MHSIRKHCKVLFDMKKELKMIQLLNDRSAVKSICIITYANIDIVCSILFDGRTGSLLSVRISAVTAARARKRSKNKPRTYCFPRGV